MTSTAAVATDRPAYPQTTETTTALGAVGAAILGIAGRVAAARARARTLRTLRSLDDYALKDIGLTRSQIASVEHDPRYEPRYARF